MAAVGSPLLTDGLALGVSSETTAVGPAAWHQGSRVPAGTVVDTTEPHVTAKKPSASEGGIVFF